LAYFSITGGLFIYLTPQRVFDFKGEGEEKKEGLSPLLDTLYIEYPLERP